MLVYISEVMCAGLVGSALQYRPIHKILTNMIDDGDLQSPFIGSAWHQSQFWRHLPHLNWGCPLLSLILGQMRSKMIVIEKPDRQSLARWSMTWSSIHFSWIGLNPASQFQCYNLPQQFNTLKNVPFHLILHSNLQFWGVQNGFQMGNDDSPPHLSPNL